MDRIVWNCRDCGTRVESTERDPEDRCSTCRLKLRLLALTAAELSALDRLIEQYEDFAAFKLLRTMMEPPPELGEDAHLVHIRRTQLGLPFRRPVPVPTVDELVQRLEGLRPHTIEASWDGDTSGWIACLDALTAVKGRVALHSFRGHDGSAAAELGSELARRLDVPFRFDSPDEPS